MCSTRPDPGGFHRHQLVWPDTGGWAALQATARAQLDPVATDCVAHWADRGWPLVVTRQPPDAGGLLAVALPAPLRWQRRRIALRLDPDRIGRFGAFPAAAEIGNLLAPTLRPGWHRLVERIDAVAAAPVRVHGSHGWQALTGEACVGAASDLDLLLPVADPVQADWVAEALAAADVTGPRLDGELLFGGAGVAWREWQGWRAGRTDRVLVKRLRGVALESSVAALT